MTSTVPTTTRPINLPDDPAVVAAGRALHALEHPCADASTWYLLDEPTRTFWINRARPIHDAVRKATA